MTAPTLFDQPAARSSDPQPSHDAAAVAVPKAATMRDLIVGIVGLYATTGATADDITSDLDYRHPGCRWQRNSVSKRCSELVAGGRLVIADHKRRAPSGVWVTVYLPGEGT